MVKYYKITNQLENHNNFQYQNGLNIILDEFDNDPESMGNGFYFTTIKYLPKYYYMGINIREIFLPKNPELKIVKLLDEFSDDEVNDKYRANMIILGKKYSLYEPATYLHFGLNMEYNIHLVNHASQYGNIDFLEKWKENNWNLKYSTDAMDLASENGHISILEWWKNSDFKIKYSKYSIDWACENGKIDVLDWWFNSGLELKYSHNALISAVKNGHKNIVEWWRNKLIPEKTSNITQPVQFIEWIKSNSLILIFNLMMMVVVILFTIYHKIF